MKKTLGVNIDHIATLREARKVREPDPVAAAVIAELAGAEGITVHLREDRRHIQERDVRLLRQTVQTHLNLEMASTPEMLQFAISVLPDMVTLVPESRHELTTEGGLNVTGMSDNLKETIRTLKSHDIQVSLFIEPDTRQIKESKKVGADYIEIHTGKYSLAYEQGNSQEVQEELANIKDAVTLARKNNLGINGGHGLNYQNIGPIAAIDGIEELNIGHSIISRSSLVGIDKAVREMKSLMEKFEKED